MLAPLTIFQVAVLIDRINLRPKFNLNFKILLLSYYIIAYIFKFLTISIAYSNNNQLRQKFCMVSGKIDNTSFKYSRVYH